MTPCWLFTGKLRKDGYARATTKGRTQYVHVAAYEAIIGPVPPGLELDHLCRVRHCYNPWHLEPVTHAENMRRSSSVGEKTTHCPAGHEYAEHGKCQPNKRDNRMDKYCSLCRAIGQRRRRLAA